MNAADVLKTARAAGVHLEIDGDDLALSAASAPPAAVLDALSLHKAEIVALLRPAEDGWSAEDRQALFEERAAILEFDGGLLRTEAEAQALAWYVAELPGQWPQKPSEAAISPHLIRA
jgi:16S rRNA U1498 N3-methylase RsmE